MSRMRVGHIRTRRGAIAAVLCIQGAVCVAGWFFAFARFAAAGAVEHTALRDATLIAGSVALSVLGLTGLATFWVMRRYEHALELANRNLGREVERRTHQNLAARDALIRGLAKLADCRDNETGLHLERISEYCELLARRLAASRPEIDEAWIERLRIASSMHDIGKVGVPDEILLKPGPLTEAERRRMQAHTRIGAETLRSIRNRLGQDELLEKSIHVALEHHERWDGAGYPFGLAAEEIALPARIVALADVYDALTSRRPYKPALSHEAARNAIVEGRGSHFDPEITDAFLAVESQFDEIRRRMHSAAERLHAAAA
ncbi:MAG TPA: HD domain-containing phosphohydrolase [Phycisphaerales bacterium]|nr:HD domain-containing phosphohydrolase [Phycisphaerales bacterium]